MNTIDNSQSKTEPQLTTIEPGDLQQLLDRKKVLLVDVREPGEHKQEQIPGSISVSLSQFDPQQIPDISDNQLVLYCQTGQRSTKATQKLLTAGYSEVTQLRGGLNAWKTAGYETKIDRTAPISIMRQVQIVAGFLVLTGVLLGTWVAPSWYILSGFVGAGLMFAGITNIALRIYVRTFSESCVNTFSHCLKFLDSLFHPGLENRPPTLYFVQVWRIGRQIPNLTSCFFYYFSDTLSFMKSGIVDDNDIPWLKLRN